MNLQSIRILDFASAVAVRNEAHRAIEINRRPTAALIFPMNGRLRFTQDGNSVIASQTQPVLIPEGASYRNECLETADSRMFNLHIASAGDRICALAAPLVAVVSDAFQSICAAAAAALPEAPALILADLYGLIGAIIRAERVQTPQEALFARAAAEMEHHLGDPSLTLQRIAAALPVSSSYLYKLFQRYSGQSPQQFLRRLRMTQAQALLSERSVTETALAVGYSDIYAFSRAYKQCFGVSPSQR